jgi:hypothetical protein
VQAPAMFGTEHPSDPFRTAAPAFHAYVPPRFRKP